SNITLKDDGNFIGVVNFNNENYLFEYVPGASTIISKFWLSDFGVDPSNTFVKASSGLLYTATNENVQKVVEYNPISNTVREVYQLESQRIQNRFSPLADGSLIGNTTSETTAGSLFHLDPQTAVFNELFEFSMPPEAIRPEGFDVDVNGKLYGVADRVETTNGNVVIEYDVATGAYRHFQMPADHYLDPSSIQLNSEGNLYGIAYTSSPELMEINLTTGEVSTMSPLDYFQEGSSLTFLTVTKDGRVFGTAEQLSAEEHAFIYEVDVTTGEMTVKKEYPGDGLFTKFVEGPDGKLYSYLFWNSDNTVVRYDVDLNEFETLGSFTGQLVGANIIPPYLSPEGKIYGMTRTGGNFNRGVLFEYDVAGNVFTNRYHFNETHTTTFGAPFVNVKDNKMFGTVSANGTGVNGYFFILDLTTNAFTTVSATPPTGRRPTGNLVKGKGAQVITFNAVENTPANSQPFQLQATSTSGLTVVYTSSNNAVAEINGNTVTIKGVGATTITASQPGNNDFYPAAPVERTLTVTKGTQTITFAEISTKTLGDAPFAITASSSSNLPISFSTTSSDKITGTPPSQIVLVKAGKATITAAQPGNENYEAAAPVDRTFCINPRKPTITVDGAKLTSSNDTGNQWYLNGTAINNATAPSFGATETGSYTVKTTVEGCASALSDAVTYTGVKDELLDLVEIYPNPTSQELFVTVPSSAVIIINDVLGRPIHQRQVVISKTEKFDVSEQPKGIYFVRIEMNENSLIRKVLIY
ncbi:MAG TPA: choice-of-anchor tandem repeat GloVer-containing protein, partial [Cyclobacteriaceae bacterium]|nr:choice-of-anchor tandem repeat GloVer-containing protein [Cyclobacteriaceae bacterium]